MGHLQDAMLPTWMRCNNTFRTISVACLSLLLLSALSGATTPASSGRIRQPLTLIKKAYSPISADFPDYQIGVKYDEYPVVVPKRAALLLDRIMVALQKAVDEDSGIGTGKDRLPLEDTRPRIPAVDCGCLIINPFQNNDKDGSAETGTTERGASLLEMLLQRGHVFLTSSRVTPSCTHIHTGTRAHLTCMRVSLCLLHMYSAFILLNFNSACSVSNDIGRPNCDNSY